MKPFTEDDVHAATLGTVRAVTHDIRYTIRVATQDVVSGAGIDAVARAATSGVAIEVAVNATISIALKTYEENE